MSLADCPCDHAGKERKRIVNEVKRLGQRSSADESAVYATVLAEYLERFGEEAEVASVKRREWLDSLWTLGAALAGAVLVILIVERWRALRIRHAAARPFRTRSRRAIKKRILNKRNMRI